MTEYATGKNAIAICDGCGFKVPYLSLRREKETQLLKCEACGCDEPRPLDRTHADARALREPRPEIVLEYDLGD